MQILTLSAIEACLPCCKYNIIKYLNTTHHKVTTSLFTVASLHCGNDMTRKVSTIRFQISIIFSIIEIWNLLHFSQHYTSFWFFIDIPFSGQNTMRSKNIKGNELTVNLPAWQPRVLDPAGHNHFHYRSPDRTHVGWTLYQDSGRRKHGEKLVCVFGSVLTKSDPQIATFFN